MSSNRRNRSYEAAACVATTETRTFNEAAPCETTTEIRRFNQAAPCETTTEIRRFNEAAPCETTSEIRMFNETAACETTTEIRMMRIPYTCGSSPSRMTPGSHRPVYKTPRYYELIGDDNNNTKPAKEGKSVIHLDFLNEDNRRAHHTEKYGVKSLVVRRGQEFSLILNLKMPFDRNQHRIQMIFSKGDKAQESKGTLIRVDIYNDKKSAENAKLQPWKGYMTALNTSGAGSSQVKVVIKPRYDALVGEYRVKTRIYEQQLHNSKITVTRFAKEEEEPMYLLFNAWCKDDQVYMANDVEREEYVLNETGRIWTGSAKVNSGRMWNFGQFSKYALRAAIHLLDVCTTLPDQGHGNVTKVVRALSAMANCTDPYGMDGGLLIGNWKNFTGGTPPTAWNGSQAIVQEYMLTKRGVKYGQCWVFSGVLTTLGRALGIPTRSVTNFESGHDHDFTLTINNHFSLAGEPLSTLDDSIWNFHVWNESWFKRPDLPDGYDGWQAYDSTPQEASEGIYRCGPAPVKAIKEGNVYLDFDARFIFAEVNGDQVMWLVDPSGEMHVVSKNPSYIGRSISTKQVGSMERMDITNQYKYPEGSAEEREVVSRASKYSSRAEELWSTYKHTAQDVDFHFDSEAKRNGDISLLLNMDNTSGEERTVDITLTVTAAYYTGIPGEELSKETLKIDVGPKKRTERKWYIKAESYINTIDEDAKIKVYLMARVKQTHQVFTKLEVYELDKPELDIQVSNGKVRVGENLEVTIKMFNPLDMKLTRGEIRLEGPGIQKNMKIPIHRSVNPGDCLTETVRLTPKYRGKREIIACFNCAQLTNISGYASVDIV